MKSDHPRLAVIAAVILIGCRAGVLPMRAAYPAPAPDIIVGKDSLSMFHSINAAVAAAPDGAVVLIRAGVYREQVTIAPGRRITLVGEGPAVTVIDGSGGYACLEVKGDSNRFVNLCLQGADAHGAWVRDGHQRFEYCLIRGNGNHGIYLSAMAGNASARVEHCTIVENPGAAIYAARDSASTLVRDCILAFNGLGLACDGPAELIVLERNLFWNDSSELGAVERGSGTILADPLFANRLESDYRLRIESPASGGASGSVRRGCF